MKLAYEVLPHINPDARSIFLLEAPSSGLSLNKLIKRFSDKNHVRALHRDGCLGDPTCLSREHLAIEHAKTSTALFKRIKARHVNFAGIDSSSASYINGCTRKSDQCIPERDKNFVAHIEDKCRKHDLIIVEIGLSHYDVVRQLDNKGYNVTGFRPKENQAAREEMELLVKLLGYDISTLQEPCSMYPPTITAACSALAISRDEEHFKILQCSSKEEMEACVQEVVSALNIDQPHSLGGEPASTPHTGEL